MFAALKKGQRRPSPSSASSSPDPVHPKDYGKHRRCSSVTQRSSYADTVDESHRTADTVDVSDRSADAPWEMPSFMTQRASSSSLPPTPKTPRPTEAPKTCLKIKTQLASLSRITSCLSSDSSQDLDKCVRFNTVEFREYSRVLGDSSATSSGPPVGIGWEYDQEIILDVDQYETCIGPRRTRQEFTIDPFTRGCMLRDVGYSRQEIAEAAKRVRKERGRQRLSLQMQRFDFVIERVESVKCGVKRISTALKRNNIHVK